MKIRIAALAALIALAGLQGAARAADIVYRPMSEFGIAIGAPFPLERLSDPSGRAIARERWQGKSVLVNFYTKYCAPCIKEVPKLNEVMRRRGDVHVLAMTPDPRAEAAKYVKQHDLRWPVAADAGAVMGKQLNVQAFPSFALLDAQGRLVATVMANQLGGEDGHATVEGIERWLDAQLAIAAKSGG